MATKKQKKQRAKREIELLPDVPPLPGPFRLARPIVRGAKFLAKELVDADPLGIITNDQVMMAMVNDPGFKLSSDMVQLINDDRRMLADTGNGMIEIEAGPGQFDRSRIVPGAKRRARKKTKTDKNMSKALREANARLRTKNGKLRKGKTQGDVMRLAHRLRRKM
jgi:hypothetical protein